MTSHTFRAVLVAALIAIGVSPIRAQAPSGPSVSASSSAAASQGADDPDLDPNKAQPDFFVTSIPTTLRLPRGKLAFRLTHRFLRPLGQGDLADLLADFFGFDSGAQMGFGLNYGVVPGGQIGFYRTSDRTIQFNGQFEIASQKRAPVGVSVVATIDGTNNFSDAYSPGLAMVVSREIGDRAALYLHPSWVNNSNLEPPDTAGDNNTTLLGLGARVRLHGGTYATFEASPRLAGYQPGAALISVGLEQRAGGHMFQLNFSNGYGTTLSQVARGGTSYDDWYIGFNLTRKFY